MLVLMNSGLLPDGSVTNSFWPRFDGSAAIFLRAHYHLHYCGSIEVQVAVTAQGHQAVSLKPIGKLISTRDKPDEGGVICRLQELYGLVSGGAALSVHGEGPILSHAWPVSHDELKISVNTADSWSAQYLWIDKDAESGPAALWVFCLFCLQRFLHHFQIWREVSWEMEKRLKGSIAGVLYCIVSGGGDGIGEPQKVKG